MIQVLFRRESCNRQCFTKIEYMMSRYLLIGVFLLLASCSDVEPDAVVERTLFPAYSDDQSQFLMTNAARADVTVTESGLQYEVLVASEGPKPTAQSNITVHYAGTLTDGTEFDSSYLRGEPSTFNLGGTIPGWVEALQLMSVGSKYRFVLPPELAYGDTGAGQIIGPGEALIFVVELLEINSI